MDTATLCRAIDGDLMARRELGRWLYRELLDRFVAGSGADERVRELIQKTSSDVFKDLAIAPRDIDRFREHVRKYGSIEQLTDKRDSWRERWRFELRNRLLAPRRRASGTSAVERPLLDEEQRALVLAHAAKLPDIYRDALEHVVIAGGDYSSLAAIEGLPTGTAASRINCAIGLVKASIRDARKTDPRYQT